MLLKATYASFETKINHQKCLEPTTPLDPSVSTQVKKKILCGNHSIPKNNLNSTYLIPFYTYKTKIMNFDSFYDVAKFEGVSYT